MRPEDCQSLGRSASTSKQAMVRWAPAGGVAGTGCVVAVGVAVWLGLVERGAMGNTVGTGEGDVGVAGETGAAVREGATTAVGAGAGNGAQPAVNATANSMS